MHPFAPDPSTAGPNASNASRLGDVPSGVTRLVRGAASCHVLGSFLNTLGTATVRLRRREGLER